MNKEAMKLALEALEKCDSALAEELAAWDIDPPLHHVLEASNACGPAIIAIREALAEQPAQQGCMRCNTPKKCALYGCSPLTWPAEKPAQQESDLSMREPSAIRDRLIQAGWTPPSQQQEPVAWMHTMIDDVVIGHRPADIARHPDRWTPLYTAPSPCPTCEALARTVMMDQTAHDTPPAQRTWVGLTDEETGHWAADFLAGAKWAEAKLKEKNT